MKITNIEIKLNHIKTIYEQQYNGWHITPYDYNEFRKTMQELNELSEAILKEVGVM